jgi:hypothetical protein
MEPEEATHLREVRIESMGRYRCPKHGNQTAPLCCRHIVEAANAGTWLSLQTVAFEIDFLDEGSQILNVVVCTSCAAAAQLHSGDRVSGELWEKGSSSGSYPWVAPTCHICIAELRNSRPP